MFNPELQQTSNEVGATDTKIYFEETVWGHEVDSAALG